MLRGSLDDFFLEDIFWLVDRARNTGRLNVTRPGGSGSFYFREGRIYWAETALLRESVERHLIRSGTITQSQLRDAESRTLAGESVGQGLVTFGMVTAEELNRALLDHLADVTFELLRRDLGEFNWEAQTGASPDYPCSASVTDLLGVSSQRLEELEQIRRDIPSDTTVLAISGGAPEDASAITVSAEQWKMLALVNGHNSVADIGRATELNELSLLRLLHGMVGRGLLEVVDEGTAATGGTAAEPERTIVLDAPAEQPLDGSLPQTSPAAAPGSPPGR